MDPHEDEILAIKKIMEDKHRHQVSPVTVKRVLSAARQLAGEPSVAVGTVKRDPQAGTIAVYVSGGVFTGWGAIELGGKLFRLEQSLVENWDLLYRPGDDPSGD